MKKQQAGKKKGGGMGGDISTAGQTK
jgi:hypothetical protein